MSQQFIVQLPNRPGELAHLAKALCARGVNIVQVHQTTAGDLTTAEIYTDCCDDDTRDVLKGMGFPFVANTNVLIEIEDNPCALGEVSDRLTHAGIDVAGCCVLSRANGRATWALSVDKEDQARRVLGLPPLAQ
jgi:hypothetical protein